MPSVESPSIQFDVKGAPEIGALPPTDAYASSAPPEIMLTTDACREVAAIIPTAQERVLATTMAIAADDRSVRMTSPMLDRARDHYNDVRVRLQADPMSYLTTPKGIPSWLVRFSPSERSRLQYLGQLPDTFAEAGAEFRWTDTPGLRKRAFPILDISHVKLVEVDDTIYLPWASVGPDIDSTTDMTAKITDRALADDLEDVLFSDEPIPDDYATTTSNGDQVWIGQAHNEQLTGINDRLGEIIANATTVVQISGKFRPTAQLYEPLQQARANGAEIDFVHNATPASAIHRARDWLGKSKNNPWMRSQSSSCKEKYGRVHATFLRADNTLALTTTLFDWMCGKGRMKELAYVSFDSHAVERGSQLFEMLYPRNRVIDQGTSAPL